MNEKEIERLIDKKVKELLPMYLRSAGFTDRKITDTPTDSLQVVNRKYVTNSGPVANRPVSSIATVGQPYFATDTNIPMKYSSSGWVNGVGSIVALNN